MKYLFSLIRLLLIQKWDGLDRWLCYNLPWYFSVSWHSLWVRKDIAHPSLEYDENALAKKIRFHKMLLVLWMQCTRSKHPGRVTESIKKSERKRLKALEQRIRKKYEDNRNARQAIARRRATPP